MADWQSRPFTPSPSIHCIKNTMASPSASLGPTSFHPTLTLSLPQAFLQPSSSSSQCQPHLLLSLPPSLFLDPFHPSTSHFKHTARIQELHYLSATTEGNVEIEKAVGWTMDRKSVPRGKREKAQADAEEAEAQLVEKLEQTEVRFVAGEGYVTKTLSSSKEGPTQVVALPNDGASSSSAAGGRKKAPPNRENETILIRLAARDDGDASGSIKVPLHARYLPPVDNSSSSIAPLSLIKSVLKSSTDGNYLDVSPSAIEAFWVCPSGGSTAAPTDDLSEGGAIWEKVLRTYDGESKPAG